MRLAPEAEILSPSDFGFHNALADAAGTLTFLDFEYAGRDDPAKLVSDFFCCPEVPVPLRFRSEFVATLAEGLPLDPAFPSRCDRLLDVYRFKWIAIIMNEFLPAEQLAAHSLIRGHMRQDVPRKSARRVQNSPRLVHDKPFTWEGKAWPIRNLLV